MFEDEDGIPVCSLCGERFEDVFEAIDHMVEDDEEFDPSLILPGGYRLMVGSLLRCLYEHREEPSMVSKIVQSTYATLYSAEVMPEIINSEIEDMIVEGAMENLDGELKKLFKDGE